MGPCHRMERGSGEFEALSKLRFLPDVVGNIPFSCLTPSSSCSPSIDVALPPWILGEPSLKKTSRCSGGHGSALLSPHFGGLEVNATVVGLLIMARASLARGHVLWKCPRHCNLCKQNQAISCSYGFQELAAKKKKKKKVLMTILDFIFGDVKGREAT